MAQITLNIPDGALSSVIDAICNQYNYAEQGGGLTRAQFAKKMLVDHVKRLVRNDQEDSLKKAALDKAYTDLAAYQLPDIT